jgi:hypothetical protein
MLVDFVTTIHNQRNRESESQISKSDDGPTVNMMNKLAHLPDVRPQVQYLHKGMYVVITLTKVLTFVLKYNIYTKVCT